MIEKYLVLLAFVLVTTELDAQEPGAPLGGSPREDSMEQIATDITVLDLIDEFIKSKGMRLGWNEGGRSFFLAVGTATVQASPEDRSYGAARINAYDKAMLMAKKEMTEFLHQEISRSISYAYEEGELPSEGTRTGAATSFSLLDKALNLAHHKLDLLLEEHGVPPDSKTTSQQIEDAIASESFQSFTMSLARSTVAGLQAYKVFEAKPAGRKGEIGVLAIHSSKLQAMAMALAGHSPPVNTRNPARSLIDQIPSDPEILLCTFGVQQRIDESGNLVLIAFGQGSPVSESTSSMSAAMAKAKLHALASLRSFAGESVATSSIMANAETTQEFESGMSIYENEDAFRQRIETTAESLGVKGAEVIHRWTAKHPLSGRSSVGVVVAWSPSGSDAALQLQRALSSRATQAAGETGFQGAGSEADDAAF